MSTTPASDEVAVNNYIKDFDGQPVIKMAILGARGVGKQSLAARMYTGRFIDDTFDPHGSDAFTVRLELAGKLVSYDGQMLAPPISPETYPVIYSLEYSMLRHLEAVILMYDVGSREGFDRVKCYFENFQKERDSPLHKTCPSCGSPTCPPRPTPFPGVVCVFANKIDRDPDEHAVSEQEGKAFADSIAAEFASISVKTGEGCRRETLEELTVRILMRRVGARSAAHQGGPQPQAGPYLGDLKNRQYWY